MALTINVVYFFFFFLYFFYSIHSNYQRWTVFILAIFYLFLLIWPGTLHHLSVDPKLFFSWLLLVVCYSVPYSHFPGSQVALLINFSWSHTGHSASVSSVLFQNYVHFTNVFSFVNIYHHFFCAFCSQWNSVKWTC